MSEFVRRVEQSRSPVRSRLAQLDMELTERCNNDCIHCCINRPANDRDARDRESSPDRIKAILRQAAELGCLRVRFTGGEPLLRPDFEDLYVFTRRLGMEVLLFTNATLINPHLADLFARMPPRAPIEITVYGMKPSSYEEVTRNPGSFSRFRRGVDLLLERNVPFLVKSVLLPQNHHEIEEFESWAETIPWMNTLPTYVVALDLRHRRDDAKKDADIKSLRSPPEEGLALGAREPAKYRQDIMEFASKFMGPCGDTLFPCGAGQVICIDAYGRAQPCLSCRAPELTLDLISKPSSLSAALAQFSLLRNMRAKNPAYLDRCARCFLKALCEQCPAKSWLEHGSLDTPVEYLCEAAHTQARYAGWLEEHERGWEVRDWRARLNSGGNGDSRTATAQALAACCFRT